MLGLELKTTSSRDLHLSVSACSRHFRCRLHSPFSRLASVGSKFFTEQFSLTELLKVIHRWESSLLQVTFCPVCMETVLTSVPESPEEKWLIFLLELQRIAF